jgi:hypothetical protein
LEIEEASLGFVPGAPLGHFLMLTGTHTNIHTDTYIHIHTHTLIFTDTYIHRYIYTHIHTYIYIYTYIYTDIYVESPGPGA